MKENATNQSALETRIVSQRSQSTDLNQWIFEQLNLSNNEKVLELCCGTGAQTNYFSRHLIHGTLTSVDVNPESIATARSSITVPNSTFIVSEIDTPEKYLTGEYDLVFSAYGFYYSNNPERLHNTLAKNLETNGRFVIVGPILGNNKQLYEIVKSIGLDIPESVLDSSENFMVRFLQIFLERYSDVRLIRFINHIDYQNHSQLMNYWKNTTFYKPGFDKDFLDASKRYFESEIRIDKSIAYLEGRV